MTILRIPWWSEGGGGAVSYERGTPVGVNQVQGSGVRCQGPGFREEGSRLLGGDVEARRGRFWVRFLGIIWSCGVLKFPD